MGKTGLATLLAAVILATAAPSHALASGRIPEEVNIEIVSDKGNAFLFIPHKVFQSGPTRVIKEYVEAKRGENYGIVIRNMASGRIGVVIAVDGRNIISGRKSDLGNTEAMYIIDGYGLARYDGWRTDKDTVHRFYFTDPSDSYSVRAFSDTSAMGVVAVAVYREKERPRPLEEMKLRGPASSAPAPESSVQGKSKALADEPAGTGFGDSRFSPAIRVSFEPEPLPLQKTLLKYEWRETLCRKGLLSCGRVTGNRLWDQDEYAPYPPGYRD